MTSTALRNISLMQLFWETTVSQLRRGRNSEKGIFHTPQVLIVAGTTGLELGGNLVAVTVAKVVLVAKVGAGAVVANGGSSQVKEPVGVPNVMPWAWTAARPLARTAKMEAFIVQDSESGARQVVPKTVGG